MPWWAGDQGVSQNQTTGELLTPVLSLRLREEEWVPQSCPEVSEMGCAGTP